MVTFEKAYELAKTRADNIEKCEEYLNGYVFWRKSKYEGVSIGGTDGGCIVVLKKDGSVMDSMMMFVMGDTGKYIGGVDLETGAHIEKDEDDE